MMCRDQLGSERDHRSVPRSVTQEICGNGTTIRDRREEATGTQYIHPITRFPSIIVIGGQSIILTTLNSECELNCSSPKLAPRQRRMFDLYFTVTLGRPG